MNKSEQAANLVRLFGMTNLQVQEELSQLQNKLGFEIGLADQGKEDFDEEYYPQFTSQIRSEAKRMSGHYEVFYCLERSIRELIRQKFIAAKGAGWWDSCVPLETKKNAANAQQKEIDSGVTPRSDDLLDYTTFGELSEIITKNWDVFGDLFSSPRAVQRVMFNLNVIRGPIAHCSELVEDEVLRLQMSVKDWFRLME
jgi:hypothetical protein